MTKKQLMTILLPLLCATLSAQPIDREAVVRRNNPHVTSLDTLSSLTVGNGGFAFTVDATGVQSFPKMYANGVSLGTMSDWGWHSFPNPENYRPEEALKAYDFGHGHTEFYATQFKEEGRAHGSSEWYRQNPHRMHLGAVGLDLEASEVKDIDQTLDLWTGLIDSRFTYRGHRYHVQTVCHPERDMIAVRVVSTGKKTIKVDFPYPTGKHTDDGCDWDEWERNITSFEGIGTSHTDTLKRVLDGKSRFDTANYYVALNWCEGHRSFVCLKGDTPLWNHNHFDIAERDTAVAFTCEFYQANDLRRSPLTFDEVVAASAEHWKNYWTKGGIVDFSHCTDSCARELERRVVLSQYLLAVNDGGDTPPQETGLTFNSWFGKFHLEMIWWHQAQFALWGHPEILEHSLDWYFTAIPKAREIAQRQGFRGVRWMKMTDPSGTEAPSTNTVRSSHRQQILWSRSPPMRPTATAMCSKAASQRKRPCVPQRLSIHLLSSPIGGSGCRSPSCGGSVAKTAATTRGMPSSTGCHRWPPKTASTWLPRQRQRPIRTSASPATTWPSWVP